LKALTFRGIETIQYESVAYPIIEHPSDVIVKVRACAICGSDLHVYYGREQGLDSGTVMGHEFMGEVVEVGKDVKFLRKGDRVMSPFTTSCGNCFYCNIGLTCRCIQSQLFGWREKSKGLHGAQAEYVRVPLADASLVKVPDGISDEEATLLGDIIPTGYFCALQAGINPKGVFAVVGCGPVGLMAILGARELGAEMILAFDKEPARLAMASRFGAEAINVSNGNPRDRINELTEGRGADGVMEAVGNASSLQLAYDLLRPGGTLSSVGVCTEKNLPFSPTQAYDKNITMKVGRCPARHLMPKLMPMVEQKKYDFTAIVTHRMNLSEGVSGYKTFASKSDNCLKVILRP
jgi:2-desacetyl-2-hydroxyethyl bacteriochlorophyllide A dehydrogenase